MAKHSVLDYVVLALLIVGAINWGLVGILNLDIVAKLLGAGSMISKVVYSVIGLSGVYGLTWFVKKH